jgi:pimeloyl-[acyl-carrier protein] synthase
MQELPYNLLSPEALANPYPIYRKLREEAPVYWSETFQSWILTRYNDVVTVLLDLRLSSERLETLAKLHLPQLNSGILDNYLDVFGRGMAMRDPPEHIRLRKIASQGFTHKALKHWQLLVQQVVNELLDKVQDAGEMDIVSDLAEPFPATVIAEMFAIPIADREMFKKCSNAIAKFLGGSFGNLEEDARLADESVMKLEAYFNDLLIERRQKLGDDLMSLLITGYEEGKMDEKELCAQCIQILAAGHVTTVDQLANGIHDLLQHQPQLQQLQSNPNLINNAVEEILRYNTSVPFTQRLAKVNLTIRDKTIQAGQIVLLSLAAANHDDKVFNSPEQFDITRKDNKHLSFAIGPHMCLGAHLARLELKIGLENLFKRLPNLRFAEDKPSQLKTESLMFRGFHSLPVKF